MTNDERTALIDCAADLVHAQTSLEFVEDDDNETIVSIHWAITDILDDIKKALK